MLIGGINSINIKLVEAIGDIVPINLVDFQELLAEKPTKKINCPPVIFLNLMDIGAFEEEIISKLSENCSSSKKIALHCFEVKTMIRDTLSRGYDAYIPIFKLSEVDHERIQ